MIEQYTVKDATTLIRQSAFVDGSESMYTYYLRYGVTDPIFGV